MSPLDDSGRKLAVFLSCLLGIAAVAVPNSATAGYGGEDRWPLEGGDLGRSSSLDGDSHGGIGEVLWSHDTGSPKTSDNSFGVSAPSYLGESLYVGTVKATLHAIDSENGEGVWKERLPWEIEFEPVLRGNKLAASSGYLHVRDGQTGVGLWNKTGQWTTPVISGDLVVAMGEARQDQNNITAISLTEGEPSWSRNLSGGPGGMLPMEERLVVPVHRSLFALDPATGETLWTNSSLPDKPGSPVLANGTIVTEAGSALVGLSPRTGEILWKEKGDYRDGDSSTLAGDGESLYVFDGSNLEKLEGRDRSRVWQTSFEDLGHSGLEPARPAVTNSTVYVGFRYVGVSGGLTAEDPGDGEDETGAGCDPARPYGYPGSGQRRALLFALDAETGEPVGALNGSGFRSPVVVNETLYVASQDGCVYSASTKPASGSEDVRISPHDNASSSEDGDEEKSDTGDGSNQTVGNDTRENTTGPIGNREAPTLRPPLLGLTLVLTAAFLARRQY